ncbi:hypothetical protein GGR57DRAFT_465230 [Xylariaceae sp. FL1272]|nr:hypothetical protein GGR57DRAFT_465230 [Xylariaceae sp. FL1272]
MEDLNSASHDAPDDVFNPSDYLLVDHDDVELHDVASTHTDLHTTAVADAHVNSLTLADTDALSGSQIKAHLPDLSSSHVPPPVPSHLPAELPIDLPVELQAELRSEIQTSLAADLVPIVAKEPAAESMTSISDTSSRKRARLADDGDDLPETTGRKPKKKKTKKIPQPESANYPSITFNHNAKLQSKISLEQLRTLILYIFTEGVAPQWVAIGNRTQFRKIVAVMVPGLEEAMFKQNVDFSTYANTHLDDANPQSRVLTSPDDYYPRLLKQDELPTILKGFADMFVHLWPVKTPGSEKHGYIRSPMGTMLTAPAEKTKEEKAGKGVQPIKEPKGWKDSRTRITEFLAMPEDFYNNDYILHPACVSPERRKNLQFPEGYVHTRVNNFEDGDVPEDQIQQGSVTAGRDVYALDCEMVVTGKDTNGKDELALARISLVSWDGVTVMDELVKPDKPIIDYVTKYSGITEEMLLPITTTLHDIQTRLLDILGPHAILVGHSLESDLKVLRMTHPFIVDTALQYPHSRGPPLKNALKHLATRFLKRDIQNRAAGHDSVEDAKACLDLIRQKCEKGKAWGNQEAQCENLFRRLTRVGTSYRANGGIEATGGVRLGKTSSMIDWGDPMKGAGAASTYPIGCKSDEEVLQGVIRAVQGDVVGEEIPAGGVDLVFARFRELEAKQGWWNNSRGDAAPPPDMSGVSLETCVQNLTNRIKQIHDALPKCTAFVIFSGSGDPRDMSRLQAMNAQFKKEYNVPGSNWDELSVRWTDVEAEALKKSVGVARNGIGFIGVK